ncbi:MAG: NAD(P)/FAD-dependent oxidoreductase [Patescibacteria group bacterium]
MENKTNGSEVYDVVVIGGGPSGIMAAGRAAELGAKVLLIEKNRKLGKKLLLTGKGRCNLTQAEFDTRKFIEKFGKKGRFLFSPLSIFGIKETIDFFEKRGLRIKIERGQRAFPENDKSESVLSVLKKYLRDNGVAIMTGAKVLKFRKQKNNIRGVLLAPKKEILAKNFIIATGGKSYPETGSTGSGIQWAKTLGHSISDLSPVLTPIVIDDAWVKDLKGLALKNIEISVIQKKKKEAKFFGEMLFTHFGVSGPIILDMSKLVGKLLKKGGVVLSFDLKPALDEQKLDKRLQRDFIKYSKKSFNNSLDDLLPKRMIPVIINLSGIDEKKRISEITKEERQKLVKLLKNLKVKVKKLCGFKMAIVTSGGVNLDEIDSRSMKSKIINNLFFAGEVIDLDGPTGGYNLQLCWTTGYVAGESAAISVNKHF